MLTSFLHAHPCADFLERPALTGLLVTLIWLAGAYERRPSAIYVAGDTGCCEPVFAPKTRRPSARMALRELLISRNIREGPD